MTTSTGRRSNAVLWTRGEGCGHLASLLADGDPVRVVGDLAEACISHRAGLLVSRRLTAFDLVDVAVPVDFQPDGVETVVAAVAGGPHSPLAAAIAHQLGRALGKPAFMACAYRDDEGRSQAISLIESIQPEVPGIEYRLVQADDASRLLADLPERTLLVLGAPGGNWFHRMLYGPGAKLRHGAPNGTVIVRRSPRRVFQVMSDPVFVGPLREAGDILRVHSGKTLAVVDGARLIGLVRRESLEAARPDTPVASLMVRPVSVILDAPLADAAALGGFFGDDPVPVVDGDGRLVGAVALSAIGADAAHWSGNP